MSDANVKLIRRGFDAFAAGDMATMSEVLAADIKWHSPGDNILSGDYDGLDATLALFARVGEETGGQITNDIHTILADDEHGVALVANNVTRQGKSHTGNTVFVFHVGGGQVTEVWAFNDDQTGVDAIWS